MLDVPAFYLEYKNLAAERTLAEFQKDVISYVLKAQNPLAVLVEMQNEAEKESLAATENPIWEVKCLQCGKPQSLDTFDWTVLSQSIKKHDQSSQFIMHFQTVDHNNQPQNWSISVAELKLTLVHVGKTVTVHLRTGTGLSVQSSGKALKNASKGDVVPIRIQHGQHGTSKSFLPVSDVIQARVLGTDEVEYVSR